LGVGGIAHATAGLDALSPGGGLPDPPSTALDQAIPLLAGIPDIPTSAIASVAMVGIPILIVAGLTPRWSSRALMAGVGATLVAAVAWSFTPTGDVDPLSVASIVVMLVAVIVWGGASAWSWIVAALAYQAFGALRDAVYGAEWRARSAGALTVLVAIALIALTLRYADRRRSPPITMTP
ncbi:MAG: hypothetical protein M3492_00785, partial [Actinomycetota bacterium]|nr:hypothetical protein [Actinomycetota bacterium]